MSQPAPKQSISRADIAAVYGQGEAAVISLVEGLLAKIATLEERVEGLENHSPFA
jgi:transposase